MKQSTLLAYLRVWAAITGILLILGYFAALFIGVRTTQTVPMLAGSIGGFELFLFAQDLWLRRSASRG